ncbi:uncharacterized protein LOC131628080 [Vicia villosa]|uniref:uncharacterized protein LOC131628080 n=1 Tax=Vicia villosa TaxID=3911 RepID=UPI00273C06E8|nr:uncharacterized protein LOC131628080 [Vicia villosa]
MSPPNAPNPIVNRTSDSLSTAASHLTHRELLCRRLRNIKRLTKQYRRMYWDLMEEVRIKHIQYVTETGLSPFEDEPDVVVDKYTNICTFDGCMSKPMPCTSFCFPHILSDSKQVLYKPCTFVIASGWIGNMQHTYSEIHDSLILHCPHAKGKNKYDDDDKEESKTEAEKKDDTKEDETEAKRENDIAEE